MISHWFPEEFSKRWYTKVVTQALHTHASSCHKVYRFSEYEHEHEHEHELEYEYKNHNAHENDYEYEYEYEYEYPKP